MKKLMLCAAGITLILSGCGSTEKVGDLKNAETGGSRGSQVYDPISSDSVEQYVFNIAVNENTVCVYKVERQFNSGDFREWDPLADERPGLITSNLLTPNAVVSEELSAHIKKYVSKKAKRLNYEYTMGGVAGLSGSTVAIATIIGAPIGLALMGKSLDSLAYAWKITKNGIPGQKELGSVSKEDLWDHRKTIVLSEKAMRLVIESIKNYPKTSGEACMPASVSVDLN